MFAALAAELARLEELARQAQEVSRTLGERAMAAVERTETFADDTVVARVASTAKRARQELGALVRAVRETKDGVVR